MGRVALEEDGLVVVDDVLPPDGFDSTGREVAYGRFDSVHRKGWDKAWRLWDGDPLRGEGIYFDPTGAFSGKAPVYPTASSVDELVDAIRDVSARRPHVVGAEGVDWVALFLSPWLYPVGSGLSLHRDAGNYTGSFTFFTHERWGVQWGGELVVWPTAIGRGHALSDDELSLTDGRGEGQADDVGIATCVFPRPNRLVMLSADRPHRITRVDTNAGAHVRASIAGFFLRPP